MSDIRRSRRELVVSILEGAGSASPAQRRAAFDAADPSGPLGSLIRKVIEGAHEITDEDVAAVRRSGFSEDSIFELVVCAAVGAATRQHEAALTALQAACVKE